MSAYDTGALEPARTQAQPIPALDERLRYAEKLARADLLPKAYQGRPANVLVSIETGHMLGIAPMAALHNIHIVEGKPTLSAALMSALVRRAGHTMRVWLDSDDKAIAELIRHDDPGFTYRAIWTTQRAKEAGLLGKDVWRKYRPNMLKNRAASEVCRDGAQEVFLGPVYVPEELGASVDSEGDPVVADEPSEPVRESAAQRIDWDGDLARFEGDKEALRQLGQLANGYDESLLPDGFRERFREAWARAGHPDSGLTADQAVADRAKEMAAENAVDEAVEAEVVEPCPGSRARFDDAGWTSIVKDDGSEMALCQECDLWQWTRAGAVVDHERPAGGDQ